MSKENIIYKILDPKNPTLLSQKSKDRYDAMSDDDIDYSDIPELDDDFWANAKIIMPPEKQSVTIRLDSDIVDFFKNGGKGYQTKINAVLRTFIEHNGNILPKG